MKICDAFAGESLSVDGRICIQGGKFAVGIKMRKATAIEGADVALPVSEGLWPMVQAHDAHGQLERDLSITYI